MAVGQPPKPPPSLVVVDYRSPTSGKELIRDNSNPSISFVDVIQGLPTKAVTPFLDPTSISFKPVSLHNGKPSVILNLKIKSVFWISSF
ncbi:hypothetical protein LIER_40237 [Lithospermum erythrorhizon]|uniref:Uncharacterized protein n=1 Tax=Lithospermum erythrorhizon TaxID=34254 RepID=A0AAV3QRF4_LITER